MLDNLASRGPLDYLEQQDCLVLKATLAVQELLELQAFREPMEIRVQLETKEPEDSRDFLAIKEAKESQAMQVLVAVQVCPVLAET